MNLYFQDEARFGLITHIGSMITAKGVAPIADFKQEFKNNYLYGSYSPIDGDAMVCEIKSVTAKAFEIYLNQLAVYRPTEYKIVVIDNARFHATKNIKIPKYLFTKYTSYTPELNPCEQIWKYIKDRYFKDLEQIKDWLSEFVSEMEANTIKSIVSNYHYLNAFYAK